MHAAHPAPAERFAILIGMLCEAIAARGPLGWLLSRLVGPVIAQLQDLSQSFARLAAHITAETAAETAAKTGPRDSATPRPQQRTRQSAPAEAKPRILGPLSRAPDPRPPPNPETFATREMPEHRPFGAKSPCLARSPPPPLAGGGWGAGSGRIALRPPPAPPQPAPPHWGEPRPNRSI